MPPGETRPEGMDYIDSLRAEDEPWLLERAFVEPPDYNLIAGSRSVIVYGQPGSGRSALATALSCGWNSNDPRLTINYLPDKTAPDASPYNSLEIAEHLLARAAAACLEFLQQQPQAYAKTDDWSRDFLAWLIQTRLEPALDASAQAQTGPEPWSAAAILKRHVENFSFPWSRPDQVMLQLNQTLGTLGLCGVQVIVNLQESWDADQLARQMQQLLVILNAEVLFQPGGVVFKILAPDSMGAGQFASARAIVTARVSEHWLEWTAEALSDLIVTRLKLASGAPQLRLDDVYKPEILRLWLERCGGLSPRGWLNYLRPIAGRFLKTQQHNRGKLRRLKEEEWLQARRVTALRLEYNPETQEYSIGSHRVRKLTRLNKLFLTYLYQHAGRVCTRQELFYEVYLPSLGQNEKSGNRSSNNYDYEVEGRQVIDPHITKLRQVLEPEPKNPVFIVTAREEGVVLYPEAFRPDRKD